MRVLARKVGGAPTLRKVFKRPWPSTLPEASARSSCQMRARCMTRVNWKEIKRNSVQVEGPSLKGQGAADDGYHDFGTAHLCTFSADQAWSVWPSEMYQFWSGNSRPPWNVPDVKPSSQAPFSMVSLTYHGTSHAQPSHPCPHLLHLSQPGRLRPWALHACSL